jgi:hypothetical protein
MVTVSQITQKLIEDNILYQESIFIGITNFTSLAKIIKPDIEKIYGDRVNLSTITRAIQRYAEIAHEKQERFKFNYFKGIKLDSNVVYIVIRESSKALDKIRTAYEEIDFKEGGVFNILHGNREIVIITNKEYKDNILDILKVEKITHVVEDHNLITLAYSKDYSYTPGLIYGISRNIAWQKINVLAWLDTPHELTLLVHDSDATKCYNILNKMQKNNQIII